ncbi:MAG: hypothetical protein ACSLE2_18945 [Lysobacterales bacterium]
MQSIDQAPVVATANAQQTPKYIANSWQSGGLPGKASWAKFWRLAAALACLVAPPGPLHAAMPALTFSASSFEYGEQRLEDVRAHLAPEGGFNISFGRMSGPGETYFGQGLALEGALDEVIREDDSLAVRMSVGALGLRGRVLLWRGTDELRLELETVNQPVTLLAGLAGLPAETAWFSRGQFDAALGLVQAADRPPDISVRFDGTDLSFDSPDGQYAGEALTLNLRGTLDFTAAPGFDLHGAFAAGELLAVDFYRNFADAALDFDVRGVWTDRAIELALIRLGDGGALAVEAAARIGNGADDKEEAPDWSLQVTNLELSFPEAYRRYLEPVAAAWALDGLEVVGTVSWNGQWQGGALTSGDLEIGDFSIVDTSRQRFAVTGLEAHLRPGDHDFDSRVTWLGLLIGSINFGGGNALLDSEPGAIALVEPLRLDVLGGHLDLAELKILLPGDRADGAAEPDIMLRANIEDLDMAQLTKALDWPAFGGRVSGEIPGVSLDDGVLAVDGEIRFEVFDGLVTVGNLGVERPFGVLPSLAAEVEISNLDLQPLTSAFSFGQIAGRLDGFIHDLRMLDWKPVAFEAWLGTPPQQERSNDISRQAVNRLTEIGGGGATAALSGPLMRMFSNFSYRRLGLGCTLRDNVCSLRGLGDNGAGVLLLEGAGVPKITIRAFNRDIDWPQMVANLLAISEGEAIQVGEAPDS